jgi:hypothetical protein
MTTVRAFTIPFTRQPAAEWETPFCKYQVVAFENSVTLGICPSETGVWHNVPVDNPERFGEFKTTKQFQSWAEAFFEGGKE